MAIDTEMGAYVARTDKYDRPLINQLDLKSEDLRDFLVNLWETTNILRIAVNERTAGIHPKTEFVNGNTWFANPALDSKSDQTPNPRQEFILPINFGALPNASSKSVAHGIGQTSDFTFTHIYATATDTTGLTGLSIPYAHATASNIVRIDIDATNVTITTGTNRTNYDICLVILKYLKN